MNSSVLLHTFVKSSIANGVLLFISTALDMAGPGFSDKKFGVGKEFASKTVAVYTNPGFYGSADRKRAHVNILVNPNRFNQPGYDHLLSDKMFKQLSFFFNIGRAVDFVQIPAHMYNHVFALSLVGAWCAKTVCFDDENKHNVNVLYNHDIPAGTYNLTITQCYPFCCETPKLKAKL